MISLQHFKKYCEIAVTPAVVRRALKISLIVGTTLNLINQGEMLISLDIEHLHILKLLLTYAVPYGVTTYTAAALQLEFQIGTQATLDVDLICKNCGEEIHLTRGDIIPESKTCGLNTQWRLK